jgi:imidazolonepropionase-like amidohydrolase
MGRPDFRLDAMTEEVRTRADASLALDARVFEMAHDAGVPILASTDASFANPWIFHGFSLHDELRRYTERGLSTREALATATVAPRRFLLGESGRIEPGTRADLLLLQGDPLQDLNLLQDPDAVIVAGHVHDRASLEAMRDALRSR